MKTRIVNMVRAASLLALGGCSTVSVQDLAEKYDRPILSAAEAESMIRVDVTRLEPVAAEQTIAALME